MGVRGVGPSLAAALGQAALAMTAVVTAPARVAPDEAVQIRCEAPGEELLLAERLFTRIPAGLGSAGQLRLDTSEMDAVLRGGAAG